MQGHPGKTLKYLEFLNGFDFKRIGGKGMAKPGSLNFDEQSQSQGGTMQRDKRHSRSSIHTAIKGKVLESAFFDSAAPRESLFA